jgi:hypothetical protein
MAESSQCIDCKFFISLGDGNICRAFPRGIPVDLTSGIFPHDKPHPDQFNKSILFVNFDDQFPKGIESREILPEDFPGGKMLDPDFEAIQETEGSGDEPFT